MSSKISRTDVGFDKKVPNVFERLSKQQVNKVNSRQRNTKPINYETRKSQNELKKSPKTLKSATINRDTETKKKYHQNNKYNNTKHEKLESRKIRPEFPVKNTYDEKVLMENVPETIDKDLDESIETSSLHSGHQLATRELSIKNSNLNIKSNLFNPGLVQKNDQEIKLQGTHHPIKDSHTEEISRNLIDINYKNGTSDRSSTTSNHKRDILLNNKPDSPKPSKHIESSHRNVSKNRSSSRSQNATQNMAFNRLNTVNKTYPPSSMTRKQNLSFSQLKTNKSYSKFDRKLSAEHAKPMVDADKDICDAESDDNEFFNVKVQTRLVSYENSTLFIRNTSKQSLEHVTESEASSLPNSPSSSSIGSSSNGREEVNINEESKEASLPILEERGQNRLRDVKSKLGQLMTRGRSILNDVYNSPLVPEVLTTFNKFQGVTRRSFKAALPLPKSIMFDSMRLSKWDAEMEKKPLEADSGFSSLISSYSDDKVVTKAKTVIDDENEPQERKDYDHTLPAASDKWVNDVPETVEGSSESSQYDGSDRGPDGTPDFGRFFSTCPCQNGDLPSSSGDVCFCQRESELPTEIQEILDADHARMWWTITGNFGNILPIDWSKTYTRQKYLPVLNLNETKKLEGSVTPSSPREDDDEEVAHDLDLHQLILAGPQQEEAEPVKSAEEVIKEIDDIMQEGSSSEDEGIDATSSDSRDSCPSELQHLPPPLYHDKLKDLNVNELNETLMELEVVIRRYSETLIAQLAHRDELEYEKELKNTFISLLLQVQNKRRNYNVEKKKLKKPMGPNGIDPKYLTTVIPYDVGHGPPDNETIQILIKILTAINDDSPTVPTLLTDYILKVLCPS